MYSGDKLSIGKTIMIRDVNGETDFTINVATYRVVNQNGIDVCSGDCIISGSTIHFSYQAEMCGTYRVIYRVFINDGEIQKTLTDNIIVREVN